jgi:selenocysteine lyase/cysteine desulfurase
LAATDPKQLISDNPLVSLEDLRQVVIRTQQRKGRLKQDQVLAIDLDEALQEQWAPHQSASIYLNTGSCGRKPKCVLAEVQEGWDRLNSNPTNFIFAETEPAEATRKEAGKLFSVPPESLMLTQNTTQALQIILQSFLLKSGDELVTTDQEHNCLYAISQYLQENRGIVTRRYKVDPFAGSKALVEGILNLVTERTRVVAVSEIFSTMGWRPQLEGLIAPLAKTRAHLLVDGAHSPGQGVVNPGRFPLWVGAGHKWLGGPNGTGFLFAQPHLVAHLQPVNIGDRFYDEYESNLQRLEWMGTTDSHVRWLGLKAALELQQELGPSNLWERQLLLLKYLQKRLTELPAHQIQTPFVESELSGMLTITWEPNAVPVPDLSSHLLDRYQIAVRPDLFFGMPGHGIRISCHASNTTAEIDALIDALKETLSAKH